MRTVDFTKLGGLHVYQSTLEFLQTGYQQAAGAIAQLIGEKIILTGCQAVGQQISDGWVSIGGEVLPLVGGAATALVDFETIVTQEQFDDATQKDVYSVKRLRLVSVATNTSFPFADLKRPVASWLTGDVKEVDCTAQYLDANFDNTGLGTGERAGWAICNGQNGTRNRAGRVAVAYDAGDPDFATLGHVAGEKGVTLTVNQLPEHDHNVVANAFNAGGSGKLVGGNAEGNDGNQNTSKTGGNQAHNNLQPYIVTLFIQKLPD